jgi:hypothetical protein
VETGAANSFALDEIPAQMRITREHTKNPGEILFNTKSTLYRLGGRVGETVRREIYTLPAIVPAYRWLDSIAPAAPALSVSGKSVTVSSPDGENPRWWLVQAHIPAHWTLKGRAAAAWATHLVRSTNPIELRSKPDRVLVQAVDAAGNTSPAVEWRRP